MPQPANTVVPDKLAALLDYVNEYLQANPGEVPGFIKALKAAAKAGKVDELDTEGAGKEPTTNESYFGRCERDERGRCMPGTGSHGARQAAGKAVGTAVGAAAGTVAGVAGGPAGAMVGAVAGAAGGRLVGGLVAKLLSKKPKDLADEDYDELEEEESLLKRSLDKVRKKLESKPWMAKGTVTTWANRWNEVGARVRKQLNLVRAEMKKRNLTTNQRTELPLHTLGRLDAELDQIVNNIFCATGPGGGIDPTCTKQNKGTKAAPMGAPPYEHKGEGKRDTVETDSDLDPDYERVGKELEAASGEERRLRRMVEEDTAETEAAKPPKKPVKSWYYGSNYPLKEPDDPIGKQTLRSIDYFLGGWVWGRGNKYLNEDMFLVTVPIKLAGKAAWGLGYGVSAGLSKTFDVMARSLGALKREFFPKKGPKQEPEEQRIQRIQTVKKVLDAELKKHHLTKAAEYSGEYARRQAGRSNIAQDIIGRKVLNASTPTTAEEAYAQVVEYMFQRLAEVIKDDPEEQKRFARAVHLAAKEIRAQQEPTMNRQQTIQYLTTNCSCWSSPKDKAILNLMDNEKLQMLAELTSNWSPPWAQRLRPSKLQNGRKRDDEEEEDEDTDPYEEEEEDVEDEVDPKDEGETDETEGVEDEEDECADDEECDREPMDKDKDKRVKHEARAMHMTKNQRGIPTTNQHGKVLTTDQWLATAPPEVQSAVRNAMEIERREKAALVTQIVANGDYSTDQERDADRQELMQQPLDGLHKMLRRMGKRVTTNQDGPAHYPNYLGQAAPVQNQSQDDLNDILPLPRMEYGERKAQ